MPNASPGQHAYIGTVRHIKLFFELHNEQRPILSKQVETTTNSSTENISEIAHTNHIVHIGHDRKKQSIPTV